MASLEPAPRGAHLPRSSTIGQALAILEEVARSRTGVTANDISRALELPRATAYRLINSLVQEEYLLRRPDLQGFILGARVVELAHHVAVPTVHERDTLLADLRRDVAEAVHFARYEGTRIVLVDEDAGLPVSAPARLAREPAYSAIGRLLLSELPREQARGLSAASDAVLDEIVEATVAIGYAQQIGLLSPDRSCLAVPVRSSDGRLVGALALATSVQRISTAVRHLGRLRETAGALGELSAS